MYIVLDKLTLTAPFVCPTDGAANGFSSMWQHLFLRPHDSDDLEPMLLHCAFIYIYILLYLLLMSKISNEVWRSAIIAGGGIIEKKYSPYACMDASLVVYIYSSSIVLFTIVVD
jgi:hypothetical protein